MKHELIFFDLDDTLFDFGKGERLAFWSTLESIGVVPTEDIFTAYQAINKVLWQKFEQNLVKKDEIKIGRFQQLFEEFEFEGNPLHASDYYVDALSQQAHLLEEALDVCTKLKAQARLAIITNGIEYIQKRRIELSPMRDHFELLIISEECGFQKPDVRIFEYALTRAAHSDRETVLMVGDRLEADIVGGLKAGLQTCWFNPKKIANGSEIRPHFEISRLSELLTF